MAVSNFKINTFDQTNNRPQVRDSNLTEIIYKEVRVEDLIAPVNYTAADNDLSTHLSGIDSALLSAGGSEFADNIFRITDNGDNTKKIAFEAAAIATATVRTVTMPNANVDLGLIASAIQQNGSVAFTANQPMGGFKLTGLDAGTASGDSVRYQQAILISGVNAFTANQSMGSFSLTNVADPSGAQDAATKAYVDSLIDGRSWKNSTKAATTAALPALTYNNGAGTLTADANGALAAQDGVTLIMNDRLVVKNQAAGLQNGIYSLTQVGSGGTPFILTRTSDTNTALELTGAAVFVEQGTVNADKQFAQSSDSITLGTTAIVWVLTSASAFSGDDMITITGGAVSVDLATNAGLVSTNAGNSAGQLQVNSDESTIERNTNSLRIKDLGVTAAKLASDSVTTAKILNSNVTEAKLATDSVSTVKIVDANVTETKLATNSVSTNKIVNLAVTSAKLASDSVTTIKIVDANVTEVKMATNSVSSAKIVDDAVIAAKINSDVAGFGLQQASNGSLEHNSVLTIQNDDAGTIAARDFAVMEADGNVVLVDANDSLNLGSTIVCALASVSSAASGKFSSGSMVVSGFSGLVEEGPVYLSRTTPGGYTQSLSGFVAGEHIFLLGQAVSATALNFEPRYIAEF